MSKRQINFRLPNELIAALRLRADAEGVNLTDLVSRLLQEGLQFQTESPVLESSYAAALAAHYCCREVVGKLDRLPEQLDDIRQVLIALENRIAGLENKINTLESFPNPSLVSTNLESTLQGTVKSIYLS